MTTANQYYPQSVSHPGETLAEKLEEMGLRPKEFAIRTGKPEKTISAILGGKSAITPDMAIQFEQVTRIPAHYWLNHQQRYDEFIAREKYGRQLDGYWGWAKHFPIADMIRKGWIPQGATHRELAGALLQFFGIGSPKAWEKYYELQALKVAFRISVASTHAPHAISAWLRRGQLQAETLDAPPYDARRFESSLPAIKQIMAAHPDDFFQRLQAVCLKTGVKVVYTPALPKAPINGATRWLGDTPLIQLTARYKRNDIFWFTFFHEAGHILLHGKKDIFLEGVAYADMDEKKEAEADDFAEEWTLSPAEEETILTYGQLNEDVIKYFAEEFGTHPAMIVGRLRHKGHCKQNQYSDLVEKVELGEH